MAPLAVSTCRSATVIRGRFSLDELDTARRASRVAAAGMQDVHVGILLDGKHEPLAVLNIHRSKSLNCQLRHVWFLLGGSNTPSYRIEMVSLTACKSALRISRPDATARIRRRRDLTLALGHRCERRDFQRVRYGPAASAAVSGAGRIVMPWEFSEDVRQRVGFDRLPSSAADFVDYFIAADDASRLCIDAHRAGRSDRRGEPERIGAVRVSAGSSTSSACRPASGRTFAPETKLAERVVLIAHGLWRRRFASDPAVSGRVISLNGEPATFSACSRTGSGFRPPANCPRRSGSR